ncbi:CHC2 zinc finger domain-containing protein [Candidatus Dojkabacteria bacterium]|jgi:hypothetical protein|nr:CHC2 zinc finger domain-containing protein [Candidatus Dojkabacteria bacterium]
MEVTYYKPEFISEKELLEIFKPHSIIKQKISEYKDELQNLDNDRVIYISKMAPFVLYKGEYLQWFWLDAAWEWSPKGLRVLWLNKQIKRLDRLLHFNDRPTGSITDNDIQSAKQYPLEELHQGNLRKSGNRLYGPCPFHNERVGSFNIYLNSNTYHCFGCGEKGDSIAYVMKTQQKDFIQTVKTLCQKNQK